MLYVFYYEKSEGLSFKGKMYLKKKNPEKN